MLKNTLTFTVFTVLCGSMKQKLKTRKDFLLDAIAKAGGPSALARSLTKICRRKVRQSHITTWRDRNQKGVPAEYCSYLESLTGVPKEKLRPDIFLPYQR